MLEFKFITGKDGYLLSEDMRKSVFCEELGIENICDEYEDSSYHFIGYDKTVQIASARLTNIGESSFKIDYVAVKKEYRRRYVGDLIMRALADKAVALGGKSIILESPAEIKGFFEFEDYHMFSEAFTKNGGDYVMMKKDLTKIQHCRGCAK